MKVLITGGGGYIGTTLSNYLISLGHEVEVFDTFWFGDYFGVNSKVVRHKTDIRGLFPIQIGRAYV